MITEKTFKLLDQIDALEGKGSRKAKMSILKDNFECLQPYIDIAMNPFRVFNVAKIPDSIPVGTKWCPNSLEELAEYLEKQRGGTNDSKNLVRTFIDHSNVLYGNTAPIWVERAILKNVRIGVEAKSLNKVGYNLPIFELLLAEPNKNNDISGISYPAYIQPKLDGCRAIRMEVDGKMTFMGRNGREVPNVQIYNHIEVAPALQDRVTLDGEFFSFKRKFNSIVGFFTADDRVLPDDIKFVVFNAMSNVDWKNQTCSRLYDDQLRLMKKVAELSKNVEVVPTYVVNNAKELMEKYQEFLDMGFEGAMARNMNTTYYWGDESDRVKVKDGIVVKLKPFEYVDCLIKGYYLGKAGGRHSHRLGGFLIDFNGVEVKCGGGYSDEQRDEYWENRDKLVGTWMRGKLTEKTEANSMRFPIFDSLRDAK